MTVTIIVLDSVGVGALPDAEQFGDAGSHTVNHTLTAAPTPLPNLRALGLGNIPSVTALPPAEQPAASFGRLVERSSGKDTTTGHWEFMGVETREAHRTFTEFPKPVMDAFAERIGIGALGNHPASGTEVIAQYDEAHRKTGKPIVYTSADSVFQVAAHVDVVPLETLYEWCEIARELLVGEYLVTRVIARPYTGAPGNLIRLGGARKDYSVAPPHHTVLDVLKAAGKEVIGVGKIPDIFAHNGFTRKVASGTNSEGIERTIEELRRQPDGLIFTNLVDFDALYGHRRDPAGYAAALAEFDARLPAIMAHMKPGDLLFLVSDHGNDPTWPGSDHTREHGLLLAYSPDLPGVALGDRSTFADVGATVAGWLGVPWDGLGTDMSADIKNRTSN